MSHTLLFVPASTWPVLLTVLTLWVFSLPQPHPSCLLWHLFLPNRKPFLQARGPAMGCPSGLACPWHQAFADTVWPAWKGFPQISAQCISHPAGRAWSAECKVDVQNVWQLSMSAPCKDVTPSPNSMLGTCFRGPQPKEKTQYPRSELSPEIQHYLHSRKIQNESNGGLKYVLNRLTVIDSREA